MNQSDLIATTYEMLEKNVIYDSKKIYNDYFHPLFKEENYYKILSRMVKNERLVYVAKGLYFTPKYKNGKQLPLKHKHIKKFMFPYRGLGFDVSESLYYRLKLTSTKSLTYTYYSNHIDEKTRTIQNTKFIKIYSEINDLIIKHIEYLDILEHFEMIPNINLVRFNPYIHSFKNMYDEKTMNQEVKAVKPEKKTIAFLKEILDVNDISNKLEIYLS